MRGPEAGPARDRKRAGRKAISPGFMPETKETELRLTPKCVALISFSPGNAGTKSFGPARGLDFPFVI